MGFFAFGEIKSNDITLRL